jgi:hypothetical protein
VERRTRTLRLVALIRNDAQSRTDLLTIARLGPQGGEPKGITFAAKFPKNRSLESFARSLIENIAKHFVKAPDGWQRRPCRAGFARWHALTKVP